MKTFKGTILTREDLSSNYKNVPSYDVRWDMFSFTKTGIQFEDDVVLFIDGHDTITLKNVYSPASTIGYV